MVVFLRALCLAVVAFLASNEANAQSVTEAADAAAVDLKPHGQVGRVDIVRLALPAIDASADVRVDAKRTRFGVKIVMTNAGVRGLNLWRLQLYQAGVGDISIYPAELGTLEAGETTELEPACLPAKGGPYGNYRLVYAAAYRDPGGKAPTYMAEPGGKAVMAAIQALSDRVKAAEKSFPR